MRADFLEILITIKNIYLGFWATYLLIICYYHENIETTFLIGIFSIHISSIIIENIQTTFLISISSINIFICLSSISIIIRFHSSLNFSYLFLFIHILFDKSLPQTENNPFTHKTLWFFLFLHSRYISCLTTSLTKSAFITDIVNNLLTHHIYKQKEFFSSLNEEFTTLLKTHCQIFQTIHLMIWLLSFGSICIKF